MLQPLLNVPIMEIFKMLEAAIINILTVNSRSNNKVLWERDGCK